MGWSGRALAPPGDTPDKQHTRSQPRSNPPTVLGIDIGKNWFHVVGQVNPGAIALRQKWSRGQVETRLADMPPCLIGLQAGVGARHLSRKLKPLGHDARLRSAKYLRPYAKGQRNDIRSAGAMAEAVQRPTMKFGGYQDDRSARPATAGIVRRQSGRYSLETRLSTATMSVTEAPAAIMPYSVAEAPEP